MRDISYNAIKPLHLDIKTIDAKFLARLHPLCSRRLACAVISSLFLRNHLKIKLRPFLVIMEYFAENRTMFVAVIFNFKFTETQICTIPFHVIRWIRYSDRPRKLH